MNEASGPSNRLNEMSRDIAQRYLNSAVILDDEAEFRPRSEQPTEGLIAPTLDTPPTKDPAPEFAAEANAHPLDAKLLTDAFADEGLVCSVIKPVEGGRFAERIEYIAGKADIVVLDWTLLGEKNAEDGSAAGDATLNLIDSILRNNSGSRISLIAIYTFVDDLESIAESIKIRIQDHQSNVARTGTIVLGDQLLIHVISKKIVLEDQLPSLLITDFSKMIEGLLPNVAMSGLAALRERTHHILRQFNATLDPAYLGHRILLPDPNDAEDHLVFALGSEILSILEDDAPGKHAGLVASRVWINEAPNRLGIDLSEPINPPNGQSPETLFGNLLEYGIDRIDESGSVIQGIKRALERQSTEVFTDNADNALTANRRFQCLLALQSHFSATSRQLKLGAVVSCEIEDGKRNYFLCLQPKCDSTRLKQTTNFPFLKLVEIDGMADLVIPGKLPGEWVNFRVPIRPRDIQIIEFLPSELPQGEVIGAINGDDCFFRSIDGVKYHWHAQLKEEHGQRTANDVATALSKPGPNDSEWLRRNG